jgi:LacI family transcriptional regulator
MKERVTIKDISREIGVSVTTVYKALNHKPKVSEAMRERILRKAAELNYTPNKLAQALASNLRYLWVMLPRVPEDFFRYAMAGIQASARALQDYNVQLVIKEVTTEQDTRDAVREMLQSDVAGLVLEPAEMLSGIIQHMDDPRQLKIPIISFVSEPIDGTPVIGVIRSDGFVLGRVAAQLLGNCVGRGKVAVFWPEGKTRIHQECGLGFQEECGRRGMDFIGCFDMTISQETAFERTGEVIDQFPGLAGIYVASYNAVGICRKLEALGRTDIRVVGQDLYPELVDCIERGSLEATMFQNQYHLAKEAVMSMFRYITEKKDPPGSRFHRPEVVMRSNLECYIGMY